ncbi:zinc ribbon domain-containing protein [Thermosynechococcus sp. FA-CM-4201]
MRIINRWEATSQVCSCCGYRWGKLDLAVRTITCENCFTTHCRDLNALKIIEVVGMGYRPTLKPTSRCDRAVEV